MSAMSALRLVRLFPLPDVVLLPETTLPLHVFEERYRRMLADALDSDRLIGMQLLGGSGSGSGDGRPSVRAIGCAGEVVRHEPLEDGRSNILLRGAFRYRIEREPATDAPYRVAEVTVLPVAPLPASAAGGSGPARLRTSNGPVRVTSFQGTLDVGTSNGPVDLVDVDGDTVAHTSNGRIHAERLNGTLDATTSNNAVDADLKPSDRPVHVQTSNGPVDLRLPDGFRREVRVNTNNSGITLHLPMSVDAHVLARTSNSSISTDFDLRMQGEFSKNHLDANIGTGGALLDLSTSNGPIRLVKH